MRKTFLGIMAIIIALSAGTTSAFASGSGANYNYADSDGENICDTADSKCTSVDTNEDDICTESNTYRKSCLKDDIKKFVDADNDGACDNYADNQSGKNGQGCGIQNKCGNNFVDADDDGICDNYADNQSGKNGQGRGVHNGCGLRSRHCK